MGTNQLHDAMYEFWSQYGFDADDVKSLTKEFDTTTLEQLFLMSQEVLVTRLNRVRLSNFQRSNALQAVLSQKNHIFKHASQRARNNHEKSRDERVSRPPSRLPTPRPSDQNYPQYQPPDHPPPEYLVRLYRSSGHSRTLHQNHHSR